MTTLYSELPNAAYVARDQVSAGTRQRRQAQRGAGARCFSARLSESNRWSAWTIRLSLRSMARAGLHHRFVRGEAALFPRRRYRIAGGARHGERSGHGRRDTVCFSVRRSLSKKVCRWRLCAASRRPSAGRPRRAACKSSRATPKWWRRAAATACLSIRSGIGSGAGRYLLSASQARPGDAVILSGSIGDHGIAILAEREGLEFESPWTAIPRRCTRW